MNKKNIYCIELQTTGRLQKELIYQCTYPFISTTDQQSAAAPLN